MYPPGSTCPIFVLCFQREIFNFLQLSLLKMENDAPVGAETAFPIRRDSLFSMELMSSSLDSSFVLHASRKLLASSSACRKLGG